MSAGAHCEIERKYLIRYPDTGLLKSLPGCEVWEITQVYLKDGEDGQTRRIRRVLTGGREKYYRTFKRRLTALSAQEDEGEISREEYERYARERDTRRRPIQKTRYRVPCAGHVLEFDVYPFWTDRAILEIELRSEDEAATIPDYVDVIRDVSGEKAYKNKQLAKQVPMEPLR